MTTTGVRWSVLGMALGFGLGLALIILAISSGWAQNGGVTDTGPAAGASQQSAAAFEGTVSAAPPASVLGTESVVGSGIKTNECYLPGRTQTLCFTINNGSTDGEWVDQILLTFPDLIGAWGASCNGALENPQDSQGYTVDFLCSTPNANQILYQDQPGGVWGISPGASWETCVDVSVPAGYDGERVIPWILGGNTGGSTADSLFIEQCTPLRLMPDKVTIEGCNGTTQSLEFQLQNFTAGNNLQVTFDYAFPGSSFSGPESIFIGEGELITLTAQLTPDIGLEPGQTVVAALTAHGGGFTDSAIITETITENAGWGRREDSPIPAMDNVVVWASHEDGGLWSIGGYGSGGAAQRYDPEIGSWITYTRTMTPVIEYPVDGCYGLNDQGQEIVVLFPDTIVTDTLQVFNITTHMWGTRPIPGFFPPEYVGKWGYDVVSLLNNPSVRPGIPDRNMCYLSGGADEPGGGRERALWRYDPETNGGEYLGYFPASVWFGFHASWYVPWIGADGGICVGGGVDHNHQVNESTQCYDIGADSFNPVNADLGQLPEPWWGMADGWGMTDQGYELWIANGVAGDGSLLPASAFFREGMSGFAYGPEVPEALYRLEGDGFQGEFYTLNGSRGGFSPSQLNLRLGKCPGCFQVFLPLMEAKQ
jgi:hypothetical protein